MVHATDKVVNMTKVQTNRFFKLTHLGNVLAYHHDKMEAKRDREARLAEKPELGHIKLLRGPDHWKGETE
jgi:hypothetical protein